MNKSNLANAIGLTLLAACFAWSASRVFRPTERVAAEAGVRTVRFAHWQLEGGLRTTLDKLARDYEQLHPGVRIEQVAVPERIFKQWLNTQLVGGTITDMVALGMGTTDEIAARYFVPLSDYVNQPNPYNRSTELETVPWRDTVIDGLQGLPSYYPNLLEHYGVSLSMFSVRVFYNRTLWHQVLGDTPPPADFDSFLALCDRVRAYAQQKGLTILPVAGSRDNAPPIIDRLFSTQTQRLNQRIDLLHDLRPTNLAQGLALLRGDWSIDAPAVQSGLRISRAAGLNFQSGYPQLGRDDASFYFVQGRALMIATGSWDSTSFRQQADFEIGVFDLPVPTATHPDYGPHMLGKASESESSTGLSFGISKASPHFELALDFLRYLSSQPVNTEFTRLSGWLPSIVGVKTSEEVTPFLPDTHGYVNGFSLAMEGLGADTKRVTGNSNGLLVGAQGSVERFTEAIRADYPLAVESDLKRASRNAILNIGRQDIIAYGFSGLSHVGDTAAAAKFSELTEAQNRREAQTAWIEHELRRLAKTP